MSDEKTFLEAWFDIIFGKEGQVVPWPRVECRGQGWGLTMGGVGIVH